MARSRSKGGSGSGIAKSLGGDSFQAFCLSSMASQPGNGLRFLLAEEGVRGGFEAAVHRGIDDRDGLQAVKDKM